jgi:hypothetical protein
VLACVDGEIDVVEDDVFAPGYVDMRQVQEGLVGVRGHDARIPFETIERVEASNG